MSDPAELTVAKNALREQLRGQRSAERSGWAEHLFEHALWQAVEQGRALAAFVGVRHEPQTREFLATAIAGGCSTFVPVMAPDETLVMARLAGVDALAPAGFGLLEPGLPEADELLVEPSALVLVPGVAFDRTGHRLGHGRGHYDRWFARANAAGITLTCIGLCTADRVLDEIPTGQYDRPMDGVLTPSGWALEPT